MTRSGFLATFYAPVLDTRCWLPYYLAHWSTRQRSSARYALGDGYLRLRIDADQMPWCPEYDGGIRVSSLQTGAFAGPVGSTIGQCHFRQDLVVREAQANVRLYTPHYATIEMRARASPDPRTMVALWMIGYEDEPHRSAEICICEIFGRDVQPDRVKVGMGLHPFGDPLITDEFEGVQLEIDACEFHIYAADWRSDQVRFYVDGRLVKTVGQAPDYPMQLMLGIYEFPDATGSPSTSQRYPKEFVVDYVRGEPLI